VCSASADGTVAFSNLQRVGHRSIKPVQVTLYRLQYDDETKAFTFVENIQAHVSYIPIFVDARANPILW
jgi:hypothetical protein